MKVTFIAKKTLFVGQIYRAVSKSYWALKVDTQTTSKWSKFVFLVHLFFDIKYSETCLYEWVEQIYELYGNIAKVAKISDI